MDDDVEALIRGRGNEVAHKLIVRRVVDDVLVLADAVSLTQSFLADGVRNIQDMKLMCDVGLSYQRSHPATPAHRICWEVEDAERP
jgi:hypothetical protein